MFLTKDQIKDKVRSIIIDENDNDIVFVVAHKGMGKTMVLNEIHDLVAFNDQLIVANGKSIMLNVSNIKRCFAEGIVAYVLRHNSLIIRKKLCNYIGAFLSPSQVIVTITRRKFNKHLIESSLCALSLNKLKEIYVDLAEDTPLIIISTAMLLSDEEIDYLKELTNDPLEGLGARITFIIGIRATPQNLECIDKITKTKTTGVWILPLLPKIEKTASAFDPKDISSISVGNSKIISNHSQLQTVLSSSVYLDTYEVVRLLNKDLWNPYYLFIMANQQISLKNYKYICELAEVLYKDVLPAYSNQLIIPNNNELLWLDALSYYFALQRGINIIINNTQVFFLKIIKEFVKDNNVIKKNKRNAYISFINDAISIKENTIATGFAKYYSDLARLAKVLFLRNTNCNHSYKDLVGSVTVLNRVIFTFNDDSVNDFDGLVNIYENTQMCFVLDVGLKAIIYYVKYLCDYMTVSETVREYIKHFLRICVLESYKWHDVTIMEEIGELWKSIKDKNLEIKLNFEEIAKDNSMLEMYAYFAQVIKKHGLQESDIIMKNTIFLSYTHVNKIIADKIDLALQKLGYNVKRDIRDIKSWNSIKDFMKTIRKEDYVVLLVSDSYLHSDNCLYEVMQLLKDDSYKKRAFPIVIDFSDKEKKTRLSNGFCMSMFEKEYIAEIILFWQKRAKTFEKKVKQLSTENRAELDEQYREIAIMAQTASIFLSSFFLNELLMTINPEKPNYKSIAMQIDETIQKSLTSCDIT